MTISNRPMISSNQQPTTKMATLPMLMLLALPIRNLLLPLLMQLLMLPIQLLNKSKQMLEFEEAYYYLFYSVFADECVMTLIPIERIMLNIKSV